MWNQVKPVLIKELKQIRRDPRALALLLVVPVVLLVLFGYALNFDIKHAKLGILDKDRTVLSRNLISSFSQSEYFDFTYSPENSKRIDDLIMKNKIALAIVVPENFSRGVKRGDGSSLQIIVDGTDPNSAGKIISYAEAIIMDLSRKISLNINLESGRRKLQEPVDYRPRVWFNPELKSVNFLVPGLIGFIIIITSVIATSLSIVREKEENTMVQILASPVKGRSLILGKTLPYLFIGIFSAGLILATGFFLFGVTIKGSIITLSISIIIYILCGLGFGLLFSSIARTQQVAYMLSTFTTLLPSIILSGFVFPIRNMPVIIQFITYLVPARYFMTIIRNIVLKGAGFGSFYVSFLALILITVVTLIASSLNLRKRGLK